MYIARKRNRVVRIPDEKVREYKEMGYTIADTEGNIVYEVKDDATKIAELERENARLKQKIAEYELLEAQKGKVETAGAEPEAKPEAKPKGRTTKNKTE